MPLQVIATSPTVNGSPWSARAVVHPHPLYGIDGEPGRSGNGLYDTMRPVGAHEVIVENARHDRHLWNADDREIEEYLALCGQRIQDLKGDTRFKYISVFKNFGSMSGQEFDHPTSEIVATTFVPRRVLYELRAAQAALPGKGALRFLRHPAAGAGTEAARDRSARRLYCLLSLRAARSVRNLDRAPQPRSLFRAYGTEVGRDARLRRAAAANAYRIRTIADGFHMVLHTSPNTVHRSETLGFWKTIEDDYHWHMEILPLLGAKAKSYTFKEVYYSPVSSETSAAILRERPTE